MDKSTPTLVLLVEDEPVVRMIAAEGLMDAGFEVIEADSAQSALAILQARDDVGVLFTDVNMPGALDGADLAQLVHDQWPAIQLIVTSGRGAPDGLPTGGQFMAKPYTLHALTEAVSHAADAED